MPSPAKPWYAEGLRFACQQCGCCCGGAPGYVWVTEDEIHALAAHLSLPIETFRQRYTQTVHRRGVTLTEKAGYDCIFFDRDRGCRVYEVRPRQCRTWPFWRSNCSCAVSWEYASEHCRGVGSGRLFTAVEIAACLDDDGLP